MERVSLFFPNDAQNQTLHILACKVSASFAVEILIKIQAPLFFTLGMTVDNKVGSDAGWVKWSKVSIRFVYVFALQTLCKVLQ